MRGETVTARVGGRGGCLAVYRQPPYTLRDCSDVQSARGRPRSASSVRKERRGELSIISSRHVDSRTGFSLVLGSIALYVSSYL